jgi:competence ComEA-like helix-hairpin-helix protein
MAVALVPPPSGGISLPREKEDPMHHIHSRHGLIAVASLAMAFMALCAVMPSMAAAAGAQIDINSASAEQLTAIPGIGKVMAERIVQFREQHGPFERVEDLLKIKGIAEKSFQRIRPYVMIAKSK